MTRHRESAAVDVWAEGTASLIRGDDLIYVAVLPLMAVIAWCVPERRWAAVCRQLASLASLVGIGRHVRSFAAIERVVESVAVAGAARDFVPALAANVHHARLQLLRCYRPPAWEPAVELIGREHIDTALDAGRGAVLWVCPLVFSDLLTKMAFHRAGLGVSHLSRTGHGFSPSRFGARWLNPIWTSIERRYLAERLVMSPQNSAGALRAMVRRLRDNRLVSVTVGGQGQSALEVPFLSGALRIADAVPRLALHTGAALLPVFTVRRADGSFATTVEPALSARRTAPAADEVAQLVLRQARRLEHWARSYPDQFTPWDLVRPAGGQR